MDYHYRMNADVTIATGIILLYNNNGREGRDNKRTTTMLNNNIRNKKLFLPKECIRYIREWNDKN